MAKGVFCVFVIVFVLGLSGCSSFKSSSSPSRWSSQSVKSSSSPFRSSSDSSGGDDADSEAERDESSYERDVRETTSSIIASGGGAAEILRDLGDVASTHGISDWEAESATFIGIGRGLAALPVDDFERMSAEIADGSSVREGLLLQGYTGEQ